MTTARLDATTARLDASAVRARRAVATVFFLNGAVLASWIPHIPAVKAAHALGDGALGLVLLAMAAGAIVAMPIAGVLIGRLGSRSMTTATAVGLAITVPVPLVAPSVPLLAAALFMLGALNGALDVSMNVQALAVEARYRRPIMSSFHALFSLGGLVGAAGAALVMTSTVGDRAHLLLTSAVASATLAFVVRGLVTTPPAASVERPLALPGRGLVALGGLAFLGLLAEGAMADWSAVYLRDSLRTTAAVAALGFGAFSLAMTAGRFAGDRMVARFGPVRVLRASSALAAAGLAVALLIGSAPIALIGFGTVGFGIANVIPVLFSGAANVRGAGTGSALAAVATTGYFGFLAGPAVIGFTAELTSLPIGLALVSAACVVIAFRGGIIQAPVELC